MPQEKKNQKNQAQLTRRPLSKELCEGVATPKEFPEDFLGVSEGEVVKVLTRVLVMGAASMEHVIEVVLRHSSCVAS